MKNNLQQGIFFSKPLRKILSFIITLTLTMSMLTGLPITAMASNNTVDSNKDDAVYVALGDSVPAGYGLSNMDDCFVNQFSDKMKKAGYSNIMYNYAVSGSTTQDLLSELQSMNTKNSDALRQLKNASVITVNIGGNNILGPLIKAVNDILSQ